MTTHRRIIGRGTTGRFVHIDARRKLKIEQYENGKLIKREKKYKKHTKRGIARLLKWLVQYRVNLRELKKNALDFQKYRRIIYENYGVLIYGENYKLIDRDKLVILDNIAHIDDHFKSMILTYVDEKEKIWKRAVRFNGVDHYERFEDIYLKIDLDKLSNELDVQLIESDYPTVLKIVMIEIIDVATKNMLRYKIKNGSV